MSSSIPARSLSSRLHGLSRIALALILVVIDLPMFLVYLLTYYSQSNLAHVDPVGHGHRTILLCWIGGSTVLAVLLLWRGARWQPARVLVVALLCLSYFAGPLIVPRVWPNPLTYETCKARGGGASAYQAYYCMHFPSQQR